MDRKALTNPHFQAVERHFICAASDGVAAASGPRNVNATSATEEGGAEEKEGVRGSREEGGSLVNSDVAQGTHQKVQVQAAGEKAKKKHKAASSGGSAQSIALKFM